MVHGPGGEGTVAHTPGPLQITVGEAFILAISVGIDRTALTPTDMLGTATLSFDLPAGYAVDSAVGFLEPVAVPLPPVLVLAVSGMVGFISDGRLRSGGQGEVVRFDGRH